MKLIDKDAVLALIDNRIKEGEKVLKSCPSSAICGLIQGYNNAKEIINSIKVEDVDLEEEVEKYFEGWEDDSEYNDAVKPDYTGVSVEECKDIARHFAAWQKLKDNEEAQHGLVVQTKTQQMCYEKGKADMKQQLKNEAVDGMLVDDGGEMLLVVLSLPTITRSMDDGDKVKVLILK